MPRCWLALGGNAGNVAETFDRCLADLDAAPENSVVAVSQYHTTAPVGAAAGEPFLNAAAEVTTDLLPLELLDVLQELEARYGRVREKYWGPRTLDLDIIFYDDVVCDRPRLILPHPACWYRRFVLDPLVEIAADVLHPTKGVSVTALRQRLLKRPLRMAICGGRGKARRQLLDELQSAFPNVEFSGRLGELQQPTLIAWLGAGDARVDWDDLPVVPRLDVTQLAGPPADALRAVLNSALGV